jgi:hypothetical protein
MTTTLPKEIWCMIFEINRKRHFDEIKEKIEHSLIFPKFTKDEYMESYFAYVEIGEKRFHFDLIYVNDIIYKSISEIQDHDYYDIFYVQLRTYLTLNNRVPARHAIS